MCICNGYVWVELSRPINYKQARQLCRFGNFSFPCRIFSKPIRKSGSAIIFALAPTSGVRGLSYFSHLPVRDDRGSAGSRGGKKVLVDELESAVVLRARP